MVQVPLAWSIFKMQPVRSSISRILDPPLPMMRPVCPLHSTTTVSMASSPSSSPPPPPPASFLAFFAALRSALAAASSGSRSFEDFFSFFSFFEDLGFLSEPESSSKSRFSPMATRCYTLAGENDLPVQTDHQKT